LISRRLVLGIVGAPRSIEIDRVDVDRPAHAACLGHRLDFRNPDAHELLQRAVSSGVQQQLCAMPARAAFHRRGCWSQHACATHCMPLGSCAGLVQELHCFVSSRGFRPQQRKTRVRRPSGLLSLRQGASGKRFVSTRKQSRQQGMTRILGLDKDLSRCVGAPRTPRYLHDCLGQPFAGAKIRAEESLTFGKW
jgi:hypothetical protein